MTPEVAKRNLEWWDRNRPAVEAHAAGKPVQYRTTAGTWECQEQPNFSRLFEWRPEPEPTLRPYTEDELRGMVGKVFVDKSNGDVHLADCLLGGQISLAGWSYLKGEELLKDATHIDGSPCGVME